MKVTEKCDVYSFGVVILETIMGHHPGELIYALSTSSSSLLSVTMHSEPLNIKALQLEDIIDKRLSAPTSEVGEEILTLTKLALDCVNANPQFRPTMKNVAQELSTHRRALPEPFCSITMGRLENLGVQLPVQESKSLSDSLS